MTKLVSKDLLRSQMNDYLSKISPSKHKSNSLLICEQLINLNPSYLTSPICSFYSTRNEVDLTAFHQFIIDKELLLYMPRFSSELNSYIFCRVTQLNNLIPGKYGILEPQPNDTCISLNEAKEFISTWLVPGIAFDHDGHRLGRGMGWYDRFLVHCKGVKIGVMHSGQLQKQLLEVDSRDISMDYLVSDSNFYTIL